MADHLTVDELQEQIQRTRLELDVILEDLSNEQLEQTVLDNGWSIKETIMHIVSWEQRLLGWLNTAAEGDTPQIPAPGYRWDEIDELNQQTVEQQAHRSTDDVIATFHTSLNLLFMALERYDDQTLNSHYFETEDTTLATIFAENTYLHYQEHTAQIEAALGH